MSDCKVSTFSHFISVWDDPFPAPTFYQHTLWLLWYHTTSLQYKQFNVHILQWMVWRGTERGEIAKRGTDKVHNKYKNTFLGVLANPHRPLFYKISKENYLHLICCMWRNSSTHRWPTTNYNIPVYLLKIPVIHTSVGYNHLDTTLKGHTTTTPVMYIVTRVAIHYLE